MIRAFRLTCLLLVLALSLSGCGRFRTANFSQQKAQTSVVEAPPTTAQDLPKQAIVEWGSPEAKVRILALSYNSQQAPYPALMQLLQDQVKQYPGKLYVKYVDLRTQQGRDLATRAGNTGGGLALLINTKREFTLEGKPYPRTITFDQEMGRFWTKEDLIAAIAQEMAAVYGK